MTVSGSVDCRFTKWANQTLHNGTSLDKGVLTANKVDGFARGKGALTESYISDGRIYDNYACFYGLDLRFLKNLKNVKLTGFSLSVKGGKYNVSTETGSSARIVFQFATDMLLKHDDLAVSNETAYTAVGESVTIASGDVPPDTVTVKTHNEFPSALTWMNNNIQKLISGYDEPTFGGRITLRYAKIEQLSLTFDYTYQVDNDSGIYIGTKRVAGG